MHVEFPTLDQRAQRRAAHHLRRQEPLAAVESSDIENPGEVRVLQRTHGRAVVRRWFGMQDSERDAHALLDILGLVEGPSTIAAELSNDQISPCGNLADEA